MIAPKTPLTAEEQRKGTLTAEEKWKQGNLSEDSIYRDVAFASTSTGETMGVYKLIFTNAKNAKDIGPFSAFPGEKEILILPGTEYTVTKAEKNVFTLEPKG